MIRVESGIYRTVEVRLSMKLCLDSRHRKSRRGDIDGPAVVRGDGVGAGCVTNSGPFRRARRLIFGRLQRNLDYSCT